MNIESLENTLALLAIRQKAGRRDTMILGGVFVLFFIATIALALLETLSGRALVLAAAMVVIFGIAALVTWVKYQIVIETMALTENLLRAEKEKAG